MNPLPSSISRLCINKKERDHRSRNCSGFHVFLSWYLCDFRCLPLQEQRKMVFVNLGVRLFGVVLPGEEEEDSIDSTNSLLLQAVPQQLAFRVACYKWSNILSPKAKEAWKRRAIQLNCRKLPGKFLTIPTSINGNDALTDNVMESLTIEWEKVTSVMKRCIMRQPKAIMSSKEYKFGDEKVQLQSQAYRAFNFSLLLELTIFGQKFQQMKASKTIKKTKKLILFHVASQQRMKDIFVQEENCATEFEVEQDNGLKYIQTCCGKVNVSYNGKNILGYILEEKNQKWKILLATNKVIFLDCLSFDRIKQEYVYQHCPSKHKPSITEYWPICLLVCLNGGGVRMPLNCFAFKVTGGCG